MSGSNGEKMLKSVYIYGSYRKNKIGVPFFWTTLYIVRIDSTSRHVRIYSLRSDVSYVPTPSDMRSVLERKLATYI